MNEPVTIATVPQAQSTGTALSAAVERPYPWQGGGATLPAPVVAVVVSLFQTFTPKPGGRRIELD